MTDNRTTELLREGLTEHGIEWRSGLEGVTVVGDWCFVEYDNGRFAATCEPVLTSEQAIAAMLGNERTAHGTLTAEQVRKAIFDGSVYASYDGAQYYADGIGMQAIADELNAELGSGTCNPIETATLENATAHVMECDMCGRTYEHVNGDYERCPRCGRKAER